MSHPTWVRGLKLDIETHLTEAEIVAPHMGAWIEINIQTMHRVDESVAPHMGAWIEIIYSISTNLLVFVA